MKRKNLIIIGIILLFILACTFIGFLILAYGYGGGKAVRPVESSKIDDLEKQIRLETQYDGSYIDKPRNYELNNCNGNMKQEISLDINNENLKKTDTLIKYVNTLNLKIQKIFPYDKKCYDSVVIQTQYFNTKRDSTITNRFSFPMIK